MNACLPTEITVAAHLLDDDATWQSVQHILDSPSFRQAPRMRSLLAYLMIRKLSGTAQAITEYAIGIDVFRRDAGGYDTADDPIVRVQMGRLRSRLASYYAGAGGSGPCIVIPSGSYIPVVSAVAPAAPARTVQLAPLRVLTPQDGGTAFVSGLEEELAVQMFQRFGHGGGGPDRLCLDVSIRVEPRRARTSARLVDTATQQVVWLKQRDCHGDLDIGLQEALARGICSDLQEHLVQACRAGAGPRGERDCYVG